MEVDAAWYRETYPDVAQNGVDPEQHYLKYGRSEGRFPRLLESLRLEQALWGGFPRRAVQELHKLYEVTASADEKSYAAWALARWYASERAWEDALPFIARLKPPLPSFLDHPGTVLLGVDVLLRTGRVDEARHWLSSAMSETPGLADWALAAANARLSNSTCYADEEALQLAWINSIWQDASLAPVEKRQPEKPLCLDNLKPCCIKRDAREGHAKVSVLMPVFNASKWIGTALTCLVEQTWRNLEVIVIDDASNDATVAIVARFASLDSRIVLLRQKRNMGAYAARNLGLQHASGDFVTNHDSDDWSHPERLASLAVPLLENPQLVATMADWARVEDGFYFQTWRAERSLIESSVATLMFRRQAARQLGGWDTVRVAADYELYRRLLRAYGRNSVLHVAPGVPLVLARQVQGSLTSAPATHLRTLLFGVRRLYQELSEVWHASAKTLHDLTLRQPPCPRAFPVPPVMLSESVENQRYDWLIMADLSAKADGSNVIQALVEQGVSEGKRLGAFHWPKFGCAAPTDPVYLSLCIENQLSFVLSDEHVIAERVFIMDSSLSSGAPDRMPKVHFRRCQIISANHRIEPGLLKNDGDIGASHAKDQLLAQPEEFDVGWYLERNPDVAAACFDPWWHYVQHGAVEGREPAPTFNTPHYLQQCPDAKDSNVPPLIHYLRVGKPLGHNPTHPVIEGDRAHRIGQPTLLLCAHAADRHLFGAERCFLDVVSACAEMSMNVLVSVPSVVNVEYIKALQARAYRVFCVPTTTWRAGVPPCSYVTSRLADIIRSENIDLVQTNTIMLREPLLAARHAGVPGVLYAHEIPEDDDELCKTIGMDAADIRKAVINQSEYMLVNSRFTGEWYDHPNGAHVVKNVVDADLFNIQNSVDDGQLTAALIGSNHPKKGLQDFVSLARLLESMGARVRLRLIGPENEYTKAISDGVANGQLPKIIDVVGYIPDSLSAIKQCNVLLNLSNCHETFGRTVLEAMASRRPVMAYRKGALPEIVNDHVNGFLFSPGDIAGIAGKLRMLSEAPEMLQTLAENGRESAMRYGLSTMQESLNLKYKKILQILR